MAIRQLKDLELSKTMAPNLLKTMAIKLTEMAQGRYLITPKHIEDSLLQLEIMHKRGHDMLLGSGLSLYQSYGGRIRLFDCPDIPGFFPFIATTVAPTTSSSTPYNIGNKPTKVVYMNMHRLGQWSSDKNRFYGMSVASDLQSVFVNAVVAAYEQDGNIEKLFGTTAVMTNMSRLYTTLFYRVLINVAENDPGQEFEKDLIRFCVAKFFLMYCLGKDDNDTVDSIAFTSTKTVNTPSGQESIKSYLENIYIDFSSLSGFLQTLGRELYKSNINLSEFVVKWAVLYGEGTQLSIEYAPFFLYFLIAAKKNAHLGGLSSLGTARLSKELQASGLDKLYTAVMQVVKS